ncbi:MAG: hypothetical protein WC044_02055 [Crocinitomicaceae bacterium]
METYNKIMRFFWLGMAIASFVIITYFCIVQGYKTWVYYYVFTFISLLMFLMKTWMMRRMKHHLKYLEEQQNNAD